MNYKEEHNNLYCSSTQTPNLDVVVDASRQNLITGVIEGDSQHLISVLEGVDCALLTNVPQLTQRQKHRQSINVSSALCDQQLLTHSVIRENL